MTNWTTLPVIRGATEITPLLHVISEMGGIVAGGYARYCVAQVKDVAPPADVDVFPLGTDPLIRGDGSSRSAQESFDVIRYALVDTIGFTVTHENAVSLTLRNPRPQDERRADCKTCGRKGEIAQECVAHPDDDDNAIFDHECPKPIACQSCAPGPITVGPAWRFHPRVQLIKPLPDLCPESKRIEDLLERFDFTISRVALRDAREAIADPDFIADDARKSLCLREIKCPISEVMRVMKYARKGYFFSPTETVKLFRDWEQRPNEWRDRIEALLTAQRDALTEEQVNELEAMMRVD